MQTEPLKITSPVVAIVMFGPPTATDGYSQGKFFQCVIDPNMVSPAGDYIRFDHATQKSEIHGWQRVEGLTVCEVLGNAPAQDYPEGVTIVPGATVIMRAISRGE